MPLPAARSAAAEVKLVGVSWSVVAPVDSLVRPSAIFMPVTCPPWRVRGERFARSKPTSTVTSGSQDFEAFEAEVAPHRLGIEAETYVGLSVRGPPELVDRLVALVRKRRPDASRVR